MNTTDTEVTRLLLVEDHPVTRLGLSTLLGGYSQFLLVGEAGTAAAAFSEADRLKPDVVLMDVRLPDGSGLDVCRRIHSSMPRTRVLILTSFADDHLVSEALAAGVDGYLLKEINGPGLVEAIETVAAGRSVLDPAVTRRVIAHAQNPKEGEQRAKVEDLSPQERRVVALVAEGMTNKQIGEALKLSDKTVKNYLSNALEKLNVSRRSQAAALYARESQAQE
jgi:two-component system, NarL family, response regulator DevR